jgi:glycopeptide antibiotics resistance protein
LALALWVGLILLAVTPWYGVQDHGHWERVEWMPFQTSPLRLRDIIANTLFYIPFGFLCLRALNVRARSVMRVVAAACLLSLMTEFSQVYSHGRFPSSTDLVCNTLGGWLGAVWADWRAGRRAVVPPTR